MIHQLFCSCSPHLSKSIPSLELSSDVATLVFYSCFLQKHECVLSVIIPASRFQLGAKPWNRRARMQLNREMRGRKQAIDFDVCKRNLLLKLSKELDKSKKGSVDEPIVDLVEYVNKTPDVVLLGPLFHLLRCLRRNEECAGFRPLSSVRSRIEGREVAVRRAPCRDPGGADRAHQGGTALLQGRHALQARTLRSPRPSFPLR